MTDPVQLRQEAERKCKGGFWQNLKGGPRHEEASELFVNAANLFKVRGEWVAAADCYSRAAEMQALQGDASQEAKYYVEAGHMHRKISAKMARGDYDLATKRFVQTGRFAQAGKLMKTLADEFEQDGEPEDALQYFKKAADYFALDEYSKSMHTQCIVKWAELIARQQNDLDAAIEIFEKEGAKALKNTLIQFGAKEHFFKAGILQLAKGDAVNASVAYEKYAQTDPRFESSREGQLLKSLCEHYEQDDCDSFVMALAEYDKVTRLDAWKVFFLNKIKGQMTQRGGGETRTRNENAMMPPPEIISAGADGEVDLT